MKKNYQCPQVRVVASGLRRHLLISSIDSGDAGIRYGGGGKGPAFAPRRTSLYDDDE